MQKVLMNISEIKDYLGIGETKIREILKDPNCNFSMKIGNRWYADKRLLDNWLTKKISEK